MVRAVLFEKVTPPLSRQFLLNVGVGGSRQILEVGVWPPEKKLKGGEGYFCISYAWETKKLKAGEGHYKEKLKVGEWRARKTLKVGVG